MVVPVKQPNVVTWTAEAWRRASFWRPSASAPGATCPPALRIATNAEAHSTTVTAAAPAARTSSLTTPG
jgi:hypothetical protein